MESPFHPYEDVRRKRVEDNLKQLEGLGIARISKSLHELTKSKPKQLKFLSSKAKILLETSELRRSSRMRNQVLSYRDDNTETLEGSDQVVDISGIRSYSRRRYKSESIGREYTGRIPSVEEKAHALKRAELLLRHVACDHPSFVKPMVRSHVSSCFWLGLPAKFCKDHLPPKETTMVLEDENGDEHEAIYIARRTGLSGGWRSFAVDHELEDGDALIFKLIEPSRFKVYIVKAIGSSAETKDSKSSIGDVCASLESSQIDGLTCKSRPSRENESADPAGNSRRRKQSRPRPSN
ncbi:hypothetical protein HPP92_014924 [Vanilla planifolia]|uniref:TF-B3 domain-containing protein n=1 Tax=Vanilla planifolia TaxID=51239 RepID=A0A835QHW2_VANPL|nr:hypothetical protein HPP92_015442 [Vanilla planifolia]KAG0475238.1 hypothetical protein HPP92_014924 [Vanilla planifolia]